MAPSPSPAAASDAQYANQFLNTALSQRGPSALPYAEDVKWLIRNHLVALADAFPSLRPRAALFTHNDGRAAHLLQADGTIPITHAGAVYNLPAVLWLPEHYPRAPPLVFLSPTRDMLIKPHHPLVDRSGLVAGAPYLRSWVFPSSNLLDLARSLSHLFGLDPPLFARSTPLPAAPSSSMHPAPSPSPRPPSEAVVYAPRPYRFPASPQLAARPAPAEDPAEVFRRNAITKLVDTAYADAATLRDAREAEVNALFAVQAELRRRGESVDGGVRRIVSEMEALERRLQDVTMATDVIEAWVAENRKEAPADGDGVGAADGAIQPADVLSRQMLDCTAADRAIEDAIYALDRAVQEGSVPFNGYLRSVRALAREQFFQRVLCTKVNNAQQQVQVARMAAPAPPQYAS